MEDSKAEPVEIVVDWCEIVDIKVDMGPNAAAASAIGLIPQGRRGARHKWTHDGGILPKLKAVPRIPNPKPIEASRENNS